jgi:hypothetical protein
MQSSSCGVSQPETWVIEECCYAGSLQQAVQKGGMQRFQEDGIPQMVSAATVSHCRVCCYVRGACTVRTAACWEVV